jgi:hypothetical protein
MAKGKTMRERRGVAWQTPIRQAHAIIRGNNAGESPQATLGRRQP